MMTGTFAHTHGGAHNGLLLDEGNVMLAEMLREHGYTTAAFIGSLPLVSDTGFNQGFSHFDQEFSAEEEGLARLMRSCKNVNRNAIAYLEAHDVAKPLFLFVHYYDPNHPLLTPPEYKDLYKGMDIDPDAMTDHLRFPNPGQYIDPKIITPHKEDNLYAYGGAITYTDEAVGDLLDALRSKGLYDNAVILLTSDHGESLWDNVPYFHHGMTLFDSTLHVPAIVKLPHSAHANTRVDVPVSTVDWVPSILETLGLPIPAGIEGRALGWPQGSASLAPQPVYSEGSRPYNARDEAAKWINSLSEKSVTDGQYRLIVRPYLKGYRDKKFKADAGDPDPPPTGDVGLYDLAADPMGHTNLLETPEGRAQYAEIYVRMSALLDEWVATADPLPAAPTHYLEAQNEMKEKLKALGYAQ